MFNESLTDCKKLRYNPNDITIITYYLGNELEFLYKDGNKVERGRFRGYKDGDPRSKQEPVIVPDQHGGTFQDMDILFGFHPDFKPNVWTDDLTGNRYVNLKGLGYADEVRLIPDATVPIGKILADDSKKYWNKTCNFKKTDIMDYADDIARKKLRNPFLEWIEDFEPTHDIPKITVENYLQTIGATAPGLNEDDERTYLSEILQAYLLAVRERQDHPIVVDMALCLIGKQGTGKTTFCRALGGSWYRSTSQDVHNTKQLMESANGGVVVEFREGLQMLNPETFKDFLDSDVLQYRKPYDRVERTYPIRFVTIITTNDNQPLIDMTGARRIAPIYLQGDVEGSLMPLDIPEEIYKGMWAEINRRYMDKEHPDRWRVHWNRIKPLAEVMQNEAKANPPFYDQILDAIGDWPKEIKLTNEDLTSRLKQALNNNNDVERAKKFIQKSPEAYGLIRAAPFKINGKTYRGYMRKPDF